MYLTLSSIWLLTCIGNHWKICSISTPRFVDIFIASDTRNIKPKITIAYNRHLTQLWQTVITNHTNNWGLNVKYSWHDLIYDLHSILIRILLIIKVLYFIFTIFIAHDGSGPMFSMSEWYTGVVGGGGLPSIELRCLCSCDSQPFCCAF